MKKNSLRDRLIQNTQLVDVAILSDSLLFNERDVISSDVPIINVALSGRVNGGLQPGVLMLAGPSKHFKTAFGLLMVASYLKKYPDAVILFYDSEFGTNESYFDLFGINRDNIIHCPITNVEDLKFDIVQQLKEITKEDHVMIFIDSIGNLASVKEVSDAEEGKSVADMTRAKQIKSLFRIITPHLTLKDIPCVVVNHTYKEIGMFPKDIVSGGTGSYYSANDIWIIGRQQDKGDDGLAGYDFIINIEKSRSVKEKSKFAVNVSFESGIFKWSGLFDLAVEAGLIQTPSKGWYILEGHGDKKFRRAEIEEADNVMEWLLKEQAFTNFLEKKYRLTTTSAKVNA